ncbi:MAG: hypothetical protein RLZZ436_2437, partial [Planctomycetota bacterium]
MAALSAIRCTTKPTLHDEHLRRRGKRHKVAMVACMRKQLTMLKPMVREKTDRRTEPERKWWG